jgi:adenylate cyclase
VAEKRVQRKLAAILAADVVGYSRLMEADEEGTRSRFNGCLQSIVKPTLEEHAGRLVKTMGDGFLVEFPSVLGAVQAAVDIQSGWSRHQQDEPADKRLQLRIGVHSGDVIVEGDDIHGDGVNIAARLEGLAEPNGICISAMIREGIRNKVDVALSDLGEKSLKNIAEPVHVYHVEWEQRVGDADNLSASDAMFRRPAVAVLPFENLSGDPDQEYFADGLTEDIITLLSKWRAFPVIARNSTFSYKGKSPDIRQVGKELGARYVIEGSVRKAANRVRVTAQLINAETGHHVWAERYDRDVEDIFELQDQLTEQIAATVTPELERTEHANATLVKPRNLTAWDYCQRGWALFKQLRAETDAAAREMFEKSIELDPTYSRPYTGLAAACFRQMRTKTGQERTTLSDQAIATGQRAVELDPTDSQAHQFLGIAFVWGRQFDRAIASEQRAIQLNPSNPGAYASLGHQLAMAGRAEEGIPYLEKALKLSPHDALDPHYQSFMARALLLAHQITEAVEWARQTVDRRPDLPESQLLLAACLGHAGEIEEARRALSECQRLQTGDSTIFENAHPIKLQADMEYFLDGLRKAGWKG